MSSINDEKSLELRGQYQEQLISGGSSHKSNSIKLNIGDIKMNLQRQLTFNAKVNNGNRVTANFGEVLDDQDKPPLKQSESFNNKVVRSGTGSKAESIKLRTINAPELANDEIYANNSIARSFGLLHKKEDHSMKSEDKFLSSDMYQQKSPQKSFDLQNQQEFQSCDKPYEMVALETSEQQQARTPIPAFEYDEELPLTQRKRLSKKNSTSVSQIFAMGNARSRASVGTKSPVAESDVKSTKNALMNVIKNPQTFGLGQNLGGSSKIISQSRQSRFSGVFTKSRVDETQQTFDWQFALGELESEENLLLRNILMTLSNPITEVFDDKGLSLLHHAVLKGIEGKTMLLIDFARNKQKISEDMLKDWINAKTLDEGWTALHYASFQGNLDAIYTLIENSANIEELNYNGLNMLHVAAQGDTAPPLYLFKMLGLNMNAQDKRGSTPLHWACYSQSETALVYLLAWSPDVNIQDKEGYTPLHLAVRSVDQVESCRPVRALLIKGARTDIRDMRLKLPHEYVRDIQSRELARELQSLLNANKSACHMITGTKPVKKVSKNPTTMIFYYILVSIVTSLKAVQVYTRQSNEMTLAAVIIDSITILLHFSLVCINPGFLKNNEIEFLKLLETFDSSSLCPECETIRTSRSRHCIICHSCVDRYDHHCPWINNCVGIRNHNLFLMYLISQMSTLCLTIYQSSEILQQYMDDKVSTLAKGHSKMDEIFDEELQEQFFVVSLSIIYIVCVLFVLPMIRLLHVQIGNFIAGKTTNERFGRQTVATPVNVTGDVTASKVQSDHYGSSGEIFTDNADIMDPEQLQLMRLQGHRLSQTHDQPYRSSFNHSTENAKFSFTSNEEEQQQIRQRQNSLILQRNSLYKKEQGCLYASFKNCLTMCCNPQAGLKGSRPTQKEIFEKHIKGSVVGQEWEQRKRSFISNNNSDISIEK